MAITEDAPEATAPGGSTQPHLHQKGQEIQTFDQLRELPIGLDAETRGKMAAGLNKVAADLRVLHDLYKKHHWVMRGPTFYQLHLLMDAHADALEPLIDSVEERVSTLGAVAVGDPRHVAELTSIERPPNGVEPVPVMLSRLLDAHEIVIKESRALAGEADDRGDTTTDDLLTSEVVPVNELQVWFVGEHLVDIPLVDA